MTKELAQIKRYVRSCLRVGRNFERVTSISPYEPILTENMEYTGPWRYDLRRDKYNSLDLIFNYHEVQTYKNLPGTLPEGRCVLCPNSFATCLVFHFTIY
jgi:hypothetical protein